MARTPLSSAPGETQFTRTPDLANFNAMQTVAACTPPLEAE
ncbi:hypothetical protein D8I24_2266 (plasmid) [Cupriavidus necator H850]|nr:hypothetical protein D8I24_2266 [Cupriavidus necator H850]